MELPDFIQFTGVVSDRGSKYAVTAGRVTNDGEIKNFLKRL